LDKDERSIDLVREGIDRIGFYEVLTIMGLSKRMALG